MGEDYTLDSTDVTDGLEARIGLEVKRLREATGMTVRAFADRVGFSASFISQLENGQVSPSIASLGKISAGLNTTLANLFQNASHTRAAIVRSKQRPSFRSSWSRAQIAALTPPIGNLEALLVTLEPTGLSGKEPSISQTDQFGFVVSGVLELTLGDELVTLRRGDAVQILAGIPNRWVNQSTRPAQFVLVSFRRSR